MRTPSYASKQVYVGLDVHRDFYVAAEVIGGRCTVFRPATAESWSMHAAHRLFLNSRL
jgi:hypothetical protein